MGAEIATFDCLRPIQSKVIVSSLDSQRQSKGFIFDLIKVLLLFCLQMELFISVRLINHAKASL